MAEVLYQERSVILDSNGRGELRFGPSRRSETWNIQRMVTNGSSTVEPEVNVYRGGETPNKRIDFSPFGNDDISETTTELKLQDGEFITVVYTGGSSSAAMVYRIEGTIEWRNLAGGSYAI